ncbi:energy transducer TonB [Acinetobacter apis]|uniref:Outer membrane transport energization protein TonB n=1 Tax=Acinetobacter apis TaxID=1229165 RepID=A0A217EG90_9GAMM|nr:energy transducer TonB [Acinetobacter apis]SNQ29342.1 outer membrane transport energization protein TonB [Acinetobacter apis]
MSHSSALNLNHPGNLKKKAIIAVAAVVIGHVGVLWTLSQLKVSTLKPVHKEPVKVQFVKIQQPAQPLPPEPKKKPEPKKEVKEVKIVKSPPPPPKHIEKIQHVKKAQEPKKVVQHVEQPLPTPAPPIVTAVETKPEPTPQPAPQPAPPAPQAEVPTEKAAKNVAIGGSGVQWSRAPKPSYEPSDLRNSPRSIMVLIEADEKGKIISATVVKSSGISALDEKILRAVRSARFKPYIENGVAYPIKAQQPFDLT